MTNEFERCSKCSGPMIVERDDRVMLRKVCRRCRLEHTIIRALRSKIDAE